MTPRIRLGLAEFAKDVHGKWRHQNADQRRINVTDHLSVALDDIEFLRDRIEAINGRAHYEVPVSEHTTDQQLAALREQVSRMVEDMAWVGVADKYADGTPRDPVNSLKVVLSMLEQAKLGVDARIRDAVEVERKRAGTAEFIEHARALAEVLSDMECALHVGRNYPPVVERTLAPPPPLPHDSRPSGDDDDDGTIVLGDAMREVSREMLSAWGPMVRAPSDDER